ncbi:MAG: cell division protein ZapA [Clostridiales bacterium]|nr:cell division protein ZapA [Clostridiales bacterium]
MNKKNDTEVLINNKRYVLCGYESSEYLHKIANYINEKYQEFRGKESFSHLEPDMRHTLMEINLADDYFRAQNKVKELQDDNERKSKDMFELKHEMIAAQTKVEELSKELQSLKFEYNEAQKKIIRLETEIEERSKKV